MYCVYFFSYITHTRTNTKLIQIVHTYIENFDMKLKSNHNCKKHQSSCMKQTARFGHKNYLRLLSGFLSGLLLLGTAGVFVIKRFSVSVSVLVSVSCWVFVQKTISQVHRIVYKLLLLLSGGQVVKLIVILYICFFFCREKQNDNISS